MLEKKEKAAGKRAAVCALVAAVLAGSIMTAEAGSLITPAFRQSKAPCEFSLLLQRSVSHRQEFLSKLSRVTGREDFGAIQTVSYKEDEGTDIWGFGSGQSQTSSSVDTFSTDCLGCHDGGRALLVTAVVRNEPYRRGHREAAADHPIGMDYSSYAGSGRKYKPLFYATGKMVLVDGKVSCLTCHDMLNPERGHLSVSDRGSALCLSCHNS